MSELDIEALKQHPLNGEDPEDFMYWAERQEAIIAALEDLERLRDIAQVLVDDLGNAAKRNPDLPLELWEAFTARNVLIAALEGYRDG